MSTSTKALMKSVENPAHAAHPVGRLDTRVLLKWMRDDELITAGGASQTAKRFAGAGKARATA